LWYVYYTQIVKRKNIQGVHKVLEPFVFVISS
jgi:hypothetical protein